MHNHQRNFVRSVKKQHAQFFTDSKLLEIGSQNVNGSVREEFDYCDYTGVDAVEGKDVDVVCYGHEYEAEAGSFDVVLTCEMLEHDPFAPKTVKRMIELLRPGGLFFMTCAGEGRGEHGTTKTGNVWGPDGDFYRNVTEEMFLEWCTAACGTFVEHHIEYSGGPRDLYFWGIKSSQIAEPPKS